MSTSFPLLIPPPGGLAARALRQDEQEPLHNHATLRIAGADAARTAAPARSPAPHRSENCGRPPPLGWCDVHALLGEARAMARRLLRFEAHAQSLPTMALVLTALRRQKLADQEWSDVGWHDREHFLAAMYRAMDRALKDHGRRRMAKKRCGQQRSIQIDDLSPDEALRIADFQPHEVERALAERPEVMEALADALALLERTHPDWASVARHRYYGGLTVEQTARVMGIGERTVRRHWEKARILLHDQIVRALRTHG
jgi:RNA polymerase sigma factor (sigma-70 family)